MRVTNHLLLVVVIRERNRRLTVAQRDDAGFLDLLERGGFLCLSKGRQGERGNQGSTDGETVHGRILLANWREALKTAVSKEKVIRSRERGKAEKHPSKRPEVMAS